MNNQQTLLTLVQTRHTMWPLVAISIALLMAALLRGTTRAQQHEIDTEALQYYYATSPAPGTIEGMLDFSRLFLGVFAPASDLLYREAVPLLMEGAYSTVVIGEAEIGGVACTQLAFSRPDVDFQIWIPIKGAPLPCKYVVTRRPSVIRIPLPS